MLPMFSKWVLGTVRSLAPLSYCLLLDDVVAVSGKSASAADGAGRLITGIAALSRPTAVGCSVYERQDNLEQQNSDAAISTSSHVDQDKAMCVLKDFDGLYMDMRKKKKRIIWKNNS